LARLVAQYLGVAALRDGKLVGYLTAMFIPEFRGRAPGAYSPEWGHAVAPGEGADVYRGMYEALASVWVAHGCLDHAVTLLAHDRQALETWFWQGFGLCNVDAARPVGPVPAGAGAPVRVRRATAADAGALLPLLREGDEHYARAPIFLHREHLMDETALSRLLADERISLWLAEDRSGLIGWMKEKIGATNACQVVRDAGTVAVCGAYVRADSRRRGVGSLLLRAVVNRAAAGGFERVTVDFEPANAPASSFWLKHFSPVCHSVLRHIDERVASLARPTRG
jgi:GNAT superfamily N-acetyltransferase